MPIENEIPEQNFELIRDQVALIIGTELANQNIINPDPLLTAGIWVERFIPYDKQELPAIKVYFNNSSYNQNIPINSKGECKIVVEVTVSAINTSASKGDIAASKNCQKLIGKIRYILEHTLYLKLALPNGVIAGTEVTDIAMGVPSDQDGLHTIAGNLILNVRYSEQNGQTTPVTGEHWSTSVKLDETERGYKIEKII
jgi:hypothetical protein